MTKTKIRFFWQMFCARSKTQTFGWICSEYVRILKKKYIARNH